MLCNETQHVWLVDRKMLCVDSCLSLSFQLVNREMFWVVTEICGEPNVVKRMKLIKHFIKIASMFLSLSSSYLILNSPPTPSLHFHVKYLHFLFEMMKTVHEMPALSCCLKWWRQPMKCSPSHAVWNDEDSPYNAYPVMLFEMMKTAHIMLTLSCCLKWRRQPI